jgi:hypothetical protein
MKAQYFDKSGKLQSTGDCPLYVQKGRSDLTSILDPNDHKGLAFITIPEYDKVVSAYKTLSREFQKAFADEAHDVLSEKRGQSGIDKLIGGQQKERYEAALAKAGLKRNEHDFAIVDDVAHKEGKSRNEGVYSVDGRPVIGRNRENLAIISSYVEDGQGFSQAFRSAQRQKFVPS